MDRPAHDRLDLRTSEDQCGDTALRLLRRALKQVPPGEILEVEADVAEHVFVVRAWARKTGRRIAAEEREGKLTRLYVEQTADG